MPRLGVIFQIGSLGDTIVSLPALRSLRELLPDCDEFILVDRCDGGGKVLPIEVMQMAVRMHGHVPYRGARSGPISNRVRSIASLCCDLRARRPHYAVNLLPTDRTITQIVRDRAFFRWCGVKELVGFEIVEKECRENQLATEAFLRLRRLWNGLSEEKFRTYANPPLLTPPVAATQRVSSWLRRNRRFPDRMLVAVSPFSNWPSKDLGREAAATLIESLEGGLSAEVVLVGSKKDLSASTHVLNRPGAGLNACGTFSVQETAALLKACKAVVAVDSGPMHVAAAVGTPTIAIYSRTNPKLYRWFPVGNGHTVLYRDTSCAGCNKPVCSVPGHPCISGVEIDEVISVTQRVIRGVRPMLASSETKLVNL